MLQPLLRPALLAANDRLRGGSTIVLPQPPLLDLDFIGRASLTYPGLPALTFTRADAATCATYRDGTGARRTALANEPRFDHTSGGVPLGLLMETAATNLLLNSTAPVTQTTGSLATGQHVLWVEGSGSAAVAGNTATITGAGTATEGSPVTFNVTVGGTVNVTVTGTLTAFQLEKVPNSTTATQTSFIATAGATVTRAADALSLTALGSWFNAAQGTLFAEFSACVNCRIFDFSDSSSNNNVIAIRCNPPTGVFNNIIRTGAAAVYNDFPSGYTARTVTRAALAYDTNNCISAFAGVAGTLDTSVALPSGLDRLRVGHDGSGTAQPVGYVRRLAYWPVRLPLGTLQALTR